MRYALFILPPLLISNALAVAASPGETYTCDFKGYGKIVIDTREPGSSITVGGTKYAAEGGSYFYQTADGTIAFFGPSLKSWVYADARLDPDLKGIKGEHCVMRRNRRSH